MSFANKLITVTGGASGIGRATVESLATDGATVYIADLNESAGKELETQFPGKVFFQRVDVSSEDQVKAFFARVKEAGTLYGAVNAAGINMAGSRLHETTTEFYRKTISVNLDGTYFCLREECRIFFEQGKGGSIVNVSSGSGLIGRPKATAYCSSKHALGGLTKAAALDYAEYGIRINAVAPGTSLDEHLLTCLGAIESPLMRNIISNEAIRQHVTNLIPMKRIGEAHEAANFILFLLSEKASYITGNIAQIDGGLLAG
jgi:NAD(P)-dependent dehydrogenase (short-subunit alcohol dehydrogenase family)